MNKKDKLNKEQTNDVNGGGFGFVFKTSFRCPLCNGEGYWTKNSTPGKQVACQDCDAVFTLVKANFDNRTADLEKDGITYTTKLL